MRTKARPRRLGKSDCLRMEKERLFYRPHLWQSRRAILSVDCAARIRSMPGSAMSPKTSKPESSMTL